MVVISARLLAAGFIALSLVFVGPGLTQSLFEYAAGGLRYRIVKGNQGDRIKEGDFAALNVLIKTDRDSVLFDSYKDGRPLSVVIPKPKYSGDIYTGIRLLTEGDSAIFRANVDSLKKQGSKSVKLTGHFITYWVKVEHVIFRKDLLENDFQKQVVEYLQHKKNKQ